MENNTLEYKILFVDVGQGDATLILQTATNNALLVDIGKFDPLLPSLKNEVKLKSIFISHFHDDHVGGLPELINWMREKNKRTILRANSQSFKNSSSKRLRSCIHEAYKDKILDLKPALSDSNQNKIDIIDGSIHVLWPSHAQQFLCDPDKKNHDCQILKFEAGLFGLLLGGDAPGDIWAKISPKLIRANILKFPHHGGKLKIKKNDWDSYQLIVTVDPQFTIASFGENNRYGHPSKEFKEAVEKLPTKKFLSTANEGNIQFKVNGHSGALCLL